MQSLEKKAAARKEAVLDKCNALAVAGLWPLEKVRPRAWLNNFKTSEDVLTACALLDHFICISDRAADSMLRSTYGKMLQKMRRISPRLANSTNQDVEDQIYFAAIPGEKSTPADSGNSLCRKVRQVLGVDRSRFVSLEVARDEHLKGHTVVFVDDFLCTGNQFKRTCKTLPELFTAGYGELHALYFLTHSSGEEAMARAVPHIHIHCSHRLTQEDSFRSIPTTPGRESNVSREMIESFLTRHAQHLRPEDGYLYDYGENPQIAFGYAQLGLMVALEGFVPDATLPVFWAPSENDGWNILMERV